jgi:Ni/Co efflux regulator RcnB
MQFFKPTLAGASAGAVALALSVATVGGVGAASAQPPGNAAGCPPGLAKKGCIPPGQAKKYAIGRSLPSDYACLDDWGRYDLEQPRDGHCYSRVDNDIVLIARATRNVIELVKMIDILAH